MRSGKSVVADYLINRHNFQREAFSKPLKDMLRAFGLNDEQLEGAHKNTPLDILGGQTPRHAMQTLGTAWGREQVYCDLWTDHWTDRVKNHIAQGVSVVEDGTRFDNEVDALRSVGGVIIFVDRKPELRGEVSQHVSEMGKMRERADHILYNNSDIKDLYDNIEALLRLIGGRNDR